GEQLVAWLLGWCVVAEHSQGKDVDHGKRRDLEFYWREGYEEFVDIAVGPFRVHVFFHPNPQVSLPVPDVMA
ncbi:GNAT family N-acetyltransferase, partial [Pseudomonas syringae]